MKKVLIVGAGAAGIFTALALSEKTQDVSIEIIDSELKIGKKFRATGNGHANLFNANLDVSNYNPSSKFLAEFLQTFKLEDLESQYLKWGVPVTKIGDLYYPMSYHAPSLVNHFSSLLAEHGIEVKLGTKMLGYEHDDKHIVVTTNSGTLVCDVLVIATGGASSPKLGSDGSLFAQLINKGYKITTIEPGLTPVATKERIIKALVGVRHKGLVTLTDGNGPVVYSENGEILYKKDGLSGICIMNISSKIKWLSLKTPLIHIDLLPGIDVSGLISENHQNEAVLESSLYSEVLFQAKKRGISFNEALHDVVYTYDRSYGFDDSQVTIGGLEDSCVKSDLSSAIEDNVYFAGEILNVDGLCGGFNLAWALISALVVSRSI